MNAPTMLDRLSLETLFQHALDGVFVIDRERRYVLFNEGCERLTGYHRGEVVGQSCQCGEVTTCHDNQGRPLWGFLCPALTLFNGTAPSAHQRMEIHRKDGSTLWVETVYTPVPNGEGRIEYVLGVVRDVTEIKLMEDELRAEMTRLREKAATAANEPDAALHDLDAALASVERAFILRALKAADGQRNKAAENMNISRSRLYRRMEALGINPNADA